MRDDKALELFNKILEKTREGILPWQGTAVPEEFIAPLENKRLLKLWPYTTTDEVGNQEGPISATLNTEKGDILVDMTHNVDGITTDELEELAMLVKRKALNIDKQVDEVIAELDNIIPF